MVSIMPGMETAAPEVLAGRGLDPVQGVLHLHLEALGKLVTVEVAEAEAAGDGEPGRDGDSDGGHLGEAGALAAEHVLHRRGAVGAPLAEEVDEGLRVGAAHAGVATSGEACRIWIRSPGSVVGYCPEKHAWQYSLLGPAARSMPSSDRYPSESTPRNCWISSIEWVAAMSS